MFVLCTVLVTAPAWTKKLMPEDRWQANNVIHGTCMEQQKPITYKTMLMMSLFKIVYAILIEMHAYQLPETTTRRMQKTLHFDSVYGCR
jgi:hypothetical protein